MTLAHISAILSSYISVNDGHKNPLYRYNDHKIKIAVPYIFQKPVKTVINSPKAYYKYKQMQENSGNLPSNRHGLLSFS